MKRICFRATTTRVCTHTDYIHLTGQLEEAVPPHILSLCTHSALEYFLVFLGVIFESHGLYQYLRDIVF